MTLNNPLRFLQKFVKRKKKKSKNESTVPETVGGRATQQAQQQGQQKPASIEEDIARIRALDTDVVGKMYEMDLVLRRYFAKEYKLGKKLSYAEMIKQLHALQKSQAEELVQRIIQYAYSGQPLDEGKMSALLTMFQQLVEAEEATKLAEKQARQAARGRGKVEYEISESGEPFAGKLRPLPAAPPLPPSEHTGFSFPSAPLNTLREKMKSVVSTLRAIHVPPVLTRVRLSHLRLRAAPPEKTAPQPRQKIQERVPAQHVPHEPPRPSLLHPGWRLPRVHVHLPHLHAPKLHTLSKVRSRIREMHVPEAVRHVHLPHFHFPHLSLSRLNFHRLSFPKIHVPELHLPHIHLPQRTPHEVHAPRHPLQKQPSGEKPSSAFSLRRMHPLRALKKFGGKTVSTTVKHLPHPHVGEYVNTLRERIHDIHPGEYVERAREHLPHLHLREYATEVKGKATELWHRIHPEKEETFAEEEAEEVPTETAEEAPEMHTKAARKRHEEMEQPQEEAVPEEKPLEEAAPPEPAPVMVEREHYWIEYRPRHHLAHVTHHLAFDVDDLHHLKPLIKEQRSGLL